MRNRIIFVFIIASIVSTGSCCYAAGNRSKPIQQNTLTPFPKEPWMQKMFRRNKILDEGRILARMGLYDEAVKKYEMSTDPSLLNDPGDAVYGLWAICTIYKYQGKLNEALGLFQNSILPLNPKKQEYIDMGLELKSLITARDTRNNKPIYDYINYIKTRYGKYLPPKGYATTHGTKIGVLIHLYDYLHDYDAGIAFMGEIIRYLANNGWADSLGGRKMINEYTRVKQAWELDKKTGQHGHLQDVIRTSDIISW